MIVGGGGEGIHDPVLLYHSIFSLPTPFFFLQWEVEGGVGGGGGRDS